MSAGMCSIAASSFRAEATIGPYRGVLDLPAEAGGGDEAPSPVEMLLGNLGLKAVERSAVRRTAAMTTHPIRVAP